MRMYSSLNSQRCLRCRLTLMTIMIGGLILIFTVTKHEEYISMKQYHVAKESAVLNLNESNQNTDFNRSPIQKINKIFNLYEYENTRELIMKIKDRNILAPKKNVHETRKINKDNINKIKTKVINNNDRQVNTRDSNKKIQKNTSTKTYSGGLHEDENKKLFCTIPDGVPSVLAERRKHAQSACDRLKGHLPLRWRLRTSPSPSMLSKLRWDQQHHLIYCNIPKAASTTWSWHLLRAVGVKEDVISEAYNVVKLMKKYLPNPEPEDAKTGILDHALKFLVTRHPFERLVSAYQNKIANPLIDRHKYQVLQKDLLATYNEDQPDGAERKVPSFRDFCRYVIKELETWLEHDAQEGKYAPDHHWVPQTFICSPCNIKYHIFSDVSTMNSDAEYIAQQCGLEGVIKTTMKLNPSTSSNLNNSNASVRDLSMAEQDNQSITANIQNEISSNYINKQNGTYERKSLATPMKRSYYYEKYFQELSELEIKQLYKLYKFDFEIFGYDIKGYLKDK